jgi:serine/threonine-protein phosphatase 2A regulatory subunit B''
MHDMVGPSDPYFFTMRDLKRSRQLSGILFNTLFNLTKFISFEMRDPFTIKQEREFVGTEWERYAKDEYVRLALEDDDEMEDDVDGYQMVE